MNRRSPCDCDHCRQDRLYRERARQCEVAKLYEQRLNDIPSVDRKVVALVTLFFALALLGVVASWWVHR